ncbi:MAG: L(+)-tartrate dehydratase beta subunit [Archaeoglobi archaeon]|nr:fumarate hydratase C-terminal domain-containing protein [Candidatus Mnemosynella bozhongmuii]MDI3502253.1 L(+)-tartrate dehydratase beta subunit [Archaeoglobi archaeon]MDK2781957.1 L(+)-tartrate dehydratase beta subunit [Archaeoglobi archaeon]
MKREFHLRTPISDEDIREISAGDFIYLTGTLVTARDAVHIRVVRDGIMPPVDLRGLAIFHAGPVMRQTENGWECLSIGPTTSTRMESLEADFIERTGIKLIVGKGFMGQKTAEACRKFGCIVTLFPGGCAALAAEKVKEVKDVHWFEDFGMPECIWVLEVENFGPLLVTIDSKGKILRTPSR